MDDNRISQIETMWSMVRRAHDEGVTAVGQAQQELLERYGGAVRRYALAALRSEDAANDISQEFALKFVRGDFSSANPDKGRFRSFVKTIALWTGKKPTLRTYEMICFYFCGMADEDELMAHIEKLKPQVA